MVEAELHVVVLPWYRQFYLRRGDAAWLSDQISPEGYEQGLEAIDGSRISEPRCTAIPPA